MPCMYEFVVKNIVCVHVCVMCVWCVCMCVCMSLSSFFLDLKK